MKIYKSSDNNTYYIFYGDINSFILELESLLSDLKKEKKTMNISVWTNTVLAKLKEGNTSKYIEMNNLITKYGFIILKHNDSLYCSDDNYKYIYPKYINDRNKEIINNFDKIIKDYEESINRE